MRGMPRKRVTARDDATPVAPAAAVQRAIEKGDPAGVRRAIAAGASTTLLPELNIAPMLWAITKRRNRCYVEVVEALLEAGAPARGPDGQTVPLIVLAADSGHEQLKTIAMIKRLLALGHDINARGPHGETALHSAANNGALAVVKFLVSRGADVTAETVAGRRPSDLARASHRFLAAEHDAVREFLLEAEGRPDKQPPGAREISAAATAGKRTRRTLSKQFEDALKSPEKLRALLSPKRPRTNRR